MEIRFRVHNIEIELDERGQARITEFNEEGGVETGIRIATNLDELAAFQNAVTIVTQESLKKKMSADQRAQAGAQAAQGTGPALVR